MNQEIRAMFTASAGRYPTKAEQALLRDWAGRVDQRLAALEELRNHEEKIIRYTVEEVMRTYPDFERRYPSGRARATRDITLTLRYCGQAMLRADLKFLEDELLLWMSTMLRGVALIQSGDTRLGDKEGTTFIVAIPEVVRQVESLRAGGSSHGQIITALSN